MRTPRTNDCHQGSGSFNAFLSQQGPKSKSPGGSQKKSASEAEASMLGLHPADSHADAVVPPLPSGSSPGERSGGSGIGRGLSVGWDRLTMTLFVPRCPVSTYTSGVRPRTGEDPLSQLCCLRGLCHQQLLLELDPPAPWESIGVDGVLDR